MDYVIVFLEGITTFISPCLLPMLPVYVSYFTGQNAEAGKGRTVLSALGFVLGFTLVFVLMGAFAGTVGKFVRQYQTAVNLVTGLVVILFGLNFLGVIRLPFLNGHTQVGLRKNRAGFFPSILFGAVFSVGWTPCVGAFLGSALMLAAQQGGLAKGILMLLRSMAPQVLALDEVTGAEDLEAMRLAAHCGVKLLATAHAAGPEDLERRPLYRRLVRENIFTDVVVLENQAGRRSCRLESLGGAGHA